jgi:hypothetical protein
MPRGTRRMRGMRGALLEIVVVFIEGKEAGKGLLLKGMLESGMVNKRRWRVMVMAGLQAFFNDLSQFRHYRLTSVLLPILR